MAEKEDARFEAVLSKNIPKRDVTWHFNDTKLSESLKYGQEFDRDSNKHVLMVRDCTLQDAGEYTITVRNNKKKATLVVKGLFYCSSSLLINIKYKNRNCFFFLIKNSHVHLSEI